MEFDTKSLLAAATAAGLVVGNKAVLPVLMCLRLSMQDAGLCLESTDLELHLKVVMPVDEVVREEWRSEEMGVIVVHAGRFLGVLGKMDSDKVQLAVKGGELMMAGGSLRARLVVMEAEDFPPPLKGPERNPAVVVSLGEKELQRLMAECLPAMSKDETRYVLNGLHCFVREEEGQRRLVVEATDGRRLVRCAEVLSVAPRRALAEDGAEMLTEQAILPGRAAVLLAKMLRGDGPVLLEYTGEAFSVAAGGFRLAGRCISGTFPNVDQVIPEKGYVLRHFNAGRLREMVGDVMPVLSDKAGTVTVTIAATGEVWVKAAEPDMGEMVESDMLVGPGARGLVITFRADYLRDSLPDEVCEIGYKDGRSPMVISGGSYERLAVVMPMRLSEVREEEEE